MATLRGNEGSRYQDKRPTWQTYGHQQSVENYWGKCFSALRGDARARGRGKEPLELVGDNGEHWEFLLGESKNETQLVQ